MITTSRQIKTKNQVEMLRTKKKIGYYPTLNCLTDNFQIIVFEEK